MPESSPPQPSGLRPENSSAILVLPDPPSPFKTADWYLKKISGMTFVLRHILTLQQAGVKRVIIQTPHANDAEILAERVSRDRRVRMDVSWVSQPKQLALAVGTKGAVLLLNGEAVFSAEEIRTALASLSGKQEPPVFQTISLLPQTFRGLLEQIDNFQPSRIETWLNEIPLDERTEANTSPRKLVYLKGREDSRIHRERDFKVQHERLLKSCGLGNDSLMDRLVTRFVSRQMTRFFLLTPFTPNQITLLSLVLGLASAWCFFQGTYEMGVVGAWVLLLSAWVDCTDGEIARLTFRESSFGGKLDIVCDNLTHFAVFFSIGMGLYYMTNQKVYILLGVLSVLGSMISFFLLSSSIIESKAAAASHKPTQLDKSLIDKLANRDFTYFLLVMALINKLSIFIALTAVGVSLFALYLLYSKMKPSRMSTEGT